MLAIADERLSISLIDPNEVRALERLPVHELGRVGATISALVQQTDEQLQERFAETGEITFDGKAAVIVMEGLKAASLNKVNYNARKEEERTVCDVINKIIFRNVKELDSAEYGRQKGKLLAHRRSRHFLQAA